MALLVFSLAGYAQVDSAKVSSDRIPVTDVSAKSLNAIEGKYSKLTAGVDKQSAKLLKLLKRKEERLQKALALKDSAKAAELFSNSASSYEQLQDKLKAPFDNNVQSFSKDYLPSLDSVSTSVAFLQKIPGVSPDKLQQLGKVNGQLQELQGKLQAADEIKEFIKQRQQQLKDALSEYGLGKQLLGINKIAYNYGQQLNEYKALINDRKKLEERLIATVREIPAFKSFWQKSSILSRLFPVPDNFGTVQALAGLQTASQINGLIQQRMGQPPSAGGTEGGQPPTAIPQQYVEQAQQQLDQLKDKVSQLGGTNGDMVMPDFQPKQKTKGFLKSLYYGMDIQTQGATSFLPVYTEIAFTVGYKVSSKIRMEQAVAYKLGLGRDISHLSFSSEGCGLRSFISLRASGSSGSTISKLFGDLWITTGLEHNYLQSFKSLRELHDNVNVWQKSFLAGLTKRYTVGKREGKVEILYDFLSRYQIPKAGSAFKFRVGFGL